MPSHYWAIQNDDRPYVDFDTVDQLNNYCAQNFPRYCDQVTYRFLGRSRWAYVAIVDFAGFIRNVGWSVHTCQKERYETGNILCILNCECVLWKYKRIFFAGRPNIEKSIKKAFDAIKNGIGDFRSIREFRSQKYY